MKKRLFSTILAASLGLTLFACGKKPAASASSPASSAAPTAAPSQLPDAELLEYGYMAYNDTVSLIVEELSLGWENPPESYNLSPVYSYSSENLAFAFQDIDDNGIDELLIGEIGYGGEVGVIYDLFTIVEDGSVIHPFSGGERDYLCLCTDGVLSEFASSGAADSEQLFYKLQKGELVKIDTLSHDVAYMDPNYNLFSDYVSMGNPWVEKTAEELAAETGISFAPTDDCTNITYYYNGYIGMAEMDGLYLGDNFCMRAQSCDSFEDISGYYADSWAFEDTTVISGLQGQVMRDITETETTDLCLWYDDVNGIMYSLMVFGPDLDGFDVEALAMQLYLPAEAPMTVG